MPYVKDLLTFQGSQLKDLVHRNLEEELKHLENEEMILSKIKKDFCQGERDNLNEVKEDVNLLSYMGFNFKNLK